MDMPSASNEPVISSIATGRRNWLDSVRTGDTDRLASMVVDDIVVVHGDGRCVCGRDEVKEDFRKGFDAFSIDQDVKSVDVIVRRQWAVEISEVKTTLISRAEGEPKEFHSTTVVALHQQQDGSWKIRRVLGLFD